MSYIFLMFKLFNARRDIVHSWHFSKYLLPRFVFSQKMAFKKPKHVADNYLSR